MNNPRVTVIVVCYNHLQYVEESIYSVLNQTFKNVELIVADDHSLDGSVELLTKLSKRLGFLFFANERNTGLNNTILKALESSTGSFISILASDDYIKPDKTEKQVKYLLETGKEGVYANGFSVINEKKELIKLNPVFTQKDNNKILHYIYQYDWGAPLLQSGLFSKKMVTNLLPLRKEYKSDDWVFLIKAFEQHNTGYMDEPLFYYRLHPTNTHKKYWFTFPMRMDIAARLVPDAYRTKTISNILLSQGQYLLADKKIFSGLKFFMSSLFLHFSFNNMIFMAKSIAVFFRNMVYKTSS